MIEIPADEVEELCHRFGVTRLAVFGSAVSGDFDPDRSDLDVLVEFADEVPDLFDAYFGLREAMEELVGRPVDLVMASAVTNPYVVQSIAENHRDLYAAGCSRLPLGRRHRQARRPRLGPGPDRVRGRLSASQRARLSADNSPHCARG